MTSTELFIESRPFLEALGLYKQYIGEIVNKQNEIYVEKKCLFKINLRVNELKRKDRRITPVDVFFDEEEGEMMILIKKIQVCKKIIHEKSLKLHELKNSTLSVFMYELASKFEHLLNRFGDIFTELKVKCQDTAFLDASDELCKKRTPKHQAVGKASGQEKRSIELMKWLKNAHRLQFNWEKLRTSQIKHAWILHDWLSITETLGGSTTSLDSQKDSKLRPIIIEWISQTDPNFFSKHDRTAQINPKLFESGDKTHAYFEIQLVAIKKQIVLISLIQERDKQLKVCLDELQQIQQQSKSGRASVFYEKALSKAIAVMDDNATLRIKKLTEFQSEYWAGLAKASTAHSALYFKFSMRLLGLMQEIPDKNSKMGSDQQSQSQKSLSDKSVMNSVSEEQMESGGGSVGHIGTTIGNLELAKRKSTILKDFTRNTFLERDGGSIPSISVSPSPSIDQLNGYSTTVSQLELQRDLLLPATSKSKKIPLPYIPSNPQKFDNNRRQSLPTGNHDILIPRSAKPPPPVPMSYVSRRQSLQSWPRAY